MTTLTLSDIRASLTRRNLLAIRRQLPAIRATRYLRRVARRKRTITLCLSAMALIELSALAVWGFLYV